MALIQKLEDWSRRPADYPETSAPQHVLLGDPAAFCIEEVQNPLMAADDGTPHRINPNLAMQQWQAMRRAMEESGLICLTLDAEPNLPDLCFTANPSFVIPVTADRRDAWLAHMRYPSRRPEVALHAGFFHAGGFLLHEMPEHVQNFEGHGDGLWHPGRFLLHAGVGSRTDAAAWQVIQNAYPKLDILLYHLQPGNQYHTDTALAPLNASTALVVPSAFDANALALLHAAFPDLIELTNSQGAALIGNAFCADGKHVFLPTSCADLTAKLEARGFRVIALDLSEFHKAGGSVFCLKQSY
ncbi:MAG: arginine deiminase-related protein [Planctomycetota bacterium]|nr:arginine deiminase-related protein [Planctomycetota bacterium]MDA1113197.1 arginine deiminase-related protein [Planctomycetota bacterium]